jgi:O-antigen/teichoic acid export membrane protein
VSEERDSRVRRVLTNSAVLAVSKVIERLSGFVVGVLVANALGADGLGVYATAWALYGLLALAGTAGGTDFLVREIGRDRTVTAAYTVHLTAIGIVVSTALMLLAQLAIRQLGYSAELETSVSIMLLAVTAKVVNSFQEGVFIAYSRVVYQTMTRVWTASAYVLASAWMLAEGAGVPALLWVFVGAEYAVTVVYFVLINRRIVRLRVRLQWRLATRLAREIRAFAASSALAALFARPEIVLLSVLATESQVGFYSAALRVAEIPLTLAEVFMANVFPLLSESFQRAEERFAAWQTGAVRLMLAGSLLFSACCFAAADDIVRLLYGTGFGDAASVLRIVAVNVVFATLIGVFYRSLVARGGQWTNVVLQSCSVVLRLASGVALIIPLAAVGAALSSALTSLVHLMLLVRATARSGAPERVLRTGWRFVVAAALAGGLMWLVGALASVPVPVTLVVGTLVYVGLMVTIGAMTPADRALLRRLRA